MHKRLAHLTLAVAVLCFVLERVYAAPAAPVAHWSFDGSGGDSSGNGNDAKPLGKVSYVPGIHGQAAQFQGTGNYFRVVNNPAVQLRSTQQFSVTAYVQPGTLDQQVILFHGRGGSTRPSWFLAVQGDLPYPNLPLYPGSFVFGVRASSDPAYTALTAKAVAGRWVHLAATYDGATLKLYADGVLQSSAAAPLPYDNAEYLHIGGDPGVVSGRSWYTGLLDDVYIFSQALTAEEVKAVMQGPTGPQLAHDPHPAHGATDVPEDTFLNWTAGQFAATHDVYLGKSFTDVDNASRTNPGSVLVSRGQTATTYIPAAILDIGQTYYWRIDEVNKAPSNTIFKGTTWSFTVESYSCPIAGASITATASSSKDGWGPEKTIDGSGMTGDFHGNDNRTMWWSFGKLPSWIQYQLDKVYKIDKLLVWNSNQMVEHIFGYSAKDVKVEYSTDGATWTALANVPKFTMAPGTPAYAANTTVSFGGVMAQYVKLTISSTWGGMDPTTGLSEVRFFCVPLQARSPAPATDATGQGLDTVLNWRPGREASSHKVFFDTDPDAVANGTAPAKIVTDHSFDPGTLLFGTTYYWRVDEIGAGGTYPGDVWSFTTQEFAAVDDFESYNDTNHRLRDTWIDGLTDGKSGSMVGYPDAPFVEQTIVHGGTQSMPLAYDNSKAPFYSETTRDLGIAQDWTGHGATHLDLWFRGYPATGMTTPTNTPASLYLTVIDKAGKSKTVIHPNPSATIASTWTQWTIPLSDLTAAGVKMTQVQKIIIGVGDRNSPQAGGLGLLYIDDIGFGHPASLPVQAHAPQPPNGAVAQGLTTTLNWRPGRDAGSHQVSFSTNLNAVASGTATAKTVTDPTFDPGPLNYGTTYYWRVDEVNAVTYPGEVWSFTTQEFAVVDDFERYNEAGDCIFDTWIDGFTDKKSGSQVGYIDAPFAEQTIVHGGRQSMPLAYDNSKAPFYSETWRYLSGGQDWTGHGATHLTLWFRGYPAPAGVAVASATNLTGSGPEAQGTSPRYNDPAGLYVVVEDSAGKSKLVNHLDPAATATGVWTQWSIPLSQLTAAGVNTTTARKITIGVGDKNSPKSGIGTIYIDDIGFGHPAQ
jgi:hypothetical protein